MWERGLKLNLFGPKGTGKTSLPMWERGLKPQTGIAVSVGQRVAPHVGAWIETILVYNDNPLSYVAPHVGAWIETAASTAAAASTNASLPMWERGLKPMSFALTSPMTSRSPCGSVD